jgi:hypothetical protein
MLKYSIIRLKGSNARFNSSNCRKNCTQFFIQEIDMEYNETKLSNYEEYKWVAYLRYIFHPQEIIMWQLFRKQHQLLEGIKAKLGLNSEAQDLESRISSAYYKLLDIFEK